MVESTPELERKAQASFEARLRLPIILVMFQRDR
jgi:hypothetical protein